MLIVHADDFGLTKAVNDGIIKAHLEGVLTSTSIMANAVEFDDAVAKSKLAPGLDIGVHLTLIEEKPLMDPNSVSTLLDDDGCFHKHATVFFKRYMLRKVSLAEIELELDLQIRKALGAGINISHLDSHQHIHILPGIMKIVVKLAKKYNIPAVRMPRENLEFYMFSKPKSFARIAQMIMVYIFASYSKSKDVCSPNFFYGFFFGGRLNEENIKTVLENIREYGVSELMCHPGLQDKGDNYQHWEYDCAGELEALISPQTLKLIQSKGIRLGSYKDLVIDCF